MTAPEIIFNRADAVKISHEIACDKALSEFEKYRVKQDKLYKSKVAIKEAVNNAQNIFREKGDWINE